MSEYDSRAINPNRPLGRNFGVLLALDDQTGKPLYIAFVKCFSGILCAFFDLLRLYF